MRTTPAARWHLFPLLALLVSAVLACNLAGTAAPPSTPAQATATANGAATGAPAATPAADVTTLGLSAAVTVTEAVTFGPGPFQLADPLVGLSALSSYTATLTATFAGTIGGKPAQWSRTYVMLAATAARQLTIQTTGDVSDPGSVYLAELDGAEYQQRGQGYCSATAIQPGSTLSQTLEPASFLNFVIGANEAGSATVNDVAARHYTFDERALGQQGQASSSGELWVAASGGYLVKYLLTTKGGADYFGDGIAGSLTQDYELTGAGQPVTIQLPAGCPAGMFDAPLLPGAADVVKLPGTITYDTPTPLAAAVAFYQKELPALGWPAADAGDMGTTDATLDFGKGSEQMTVSLAAAANVTSVNIFVSRVPP